MTGEDAAATVSYWTETIGAHIIEWDSIKKKTFHKEWSIEHFDFVI